MHRESDDSDHDVESITEHTDHVEHSIYSDKSDDRDNLLEFEDCVNLIQNDTDTDSSTDDGLNNALDKLNELTIDNRVTDSSTSKLLKILKPLIPSLPRDPRTLKKKPRTHYTIVEKCGE